MPSEEEKEQDGLKKHFDETSAPAGEPGAAPEEAAQPPAAPEEAAEEEQEEQAEEPATGAEKKERKLWPLALVLTLCVLAGGGYYALTGMRQTAHKLGGGSEYDQLAANSSVYEGKAGGYRDQDVFAGGEEGALSSKDAAAAGGSRVNPALARSKEELVAEARGGGSSASGAGQAAAEQEQAQDGQGAAPAPQGGNAMASKLQAKAFLSPGPGASRSKGGAPGGTAAFEGSGTLVGRASAQRETKAAAPRQGGKSSVIDSLKGAFKASIYGARISSQDSAKSWISRAFDATPEATTAIEYDEKVRAKLDRVNPNSIPQFLRDQDVTADDAKRLADSKVSKPKMDRDGTDDALDRDKDYQSKKLANDFSGSMINGLFAGISGTGGEEDKPDSKSEPPGEDPSGDTQGYGGFADPDDTEAAVENELQAWVDTNGYGAECGCTQTAPCCCLPQNTVTQNCPTYGPFLPNDPCAAGFYGTDTNTGAGVVP